MPLGIAEILSACADVFLQLQIKHYLIVFINKGRSRKNFLTLSFLLKILPLKDDELVGHQLCFGHNVPGRTPKSE